MGLVGHSLGRYRMLSKSAFAKSKAKAARARGGAFKEQSLREEWFAIGRAWAELSQEHDEVESRRANLAGAASAAVLIEPSVDVQ